MWYALLLGLLVGGFIVHLVNQHFAVSAYTPSLVIHLTNYEEERPSSKWQLQPLHIIESLRIEDIPQGWSPAVRFVLFDRQGQEREEPFYYALRSHGDHIRIDFAQQLSIADFLQVEIILEYGDHPIKERKYSLYWPSDNYLAKLKAISAVLNQTDPE